MYKIWRQGVGAARSEVPNAATKLKARAQRIQRQKQQLEKQKQQLEANNRQVAHLQKKLSAKDQQIMRLDAGITRGEVRDLQRRVKAQTRQLEQMRKKLSAKDQQMALWEAAKDDEVEWWHEWFVTKGLIWRPEEYKFALDPKQPLQDYIIRHLSAPLGVMVSILDVGAGPLTKLGKRWEGRAVQIIAVDPLADEYKHLLAAFNITPPVQTQFGEVERLTEVFSKNYFDLVHMQNALDHSYDPLLGIRQMLEVVKPGGYVLLPHFVNEAENGNYDGFHQWNFCAENGHFVIWNRNTRVSVNDALGDAAEITVNESQVSKDEKDQIQGEIFVSLRKKV